MGDVSTILLDKKLFRDHLEFWRQLIDLDQTQRMLLWASIQRQAYREVGLDYDWNSDQPVPILPQVVAEQPQEDVIEGAGHYL